jgi:hypothetical protein
MIVIFGDLMKEIIRGYFLTKISIPINKKGHKDALVLPLRLKKISLHTKPNNFCFNQIYITSEYL